MRRLPVLLALALAALLALAGGSPVAADGRTSGAADRVGDRAEEGIRGDGGRHRGDDDGRHRRGDGFPTVIPLPVGFYPEGVEVGARTDLFVGSVLDGALFKGDLATGEGAVLAEGVDGRVVAGLEFDRRTGSVWAAGSEGGEGRLFAFDAESGEVEHAIPVPGAGLLNDLVVTRRAIHATDSFAPVFWTQRLDRHGEPQGDPTSVPLTGDFQFVAEGDPFAVNLNGIVATDRGARTLVAAHTDLGVLYAVDARTGAATEIDLGEATLPSVDGIVLSGRTLYAVRNFPNTISVVELAPDARSGRLVAEVTSPLFRVPTTADASPIGLYAVNSRFDEGFPPSFGGEPKSLEYEVVRLPLR